MRRISLRGTGGCRGVPVLFVVVVIFFLFIVGVPVGGGVVVGLGVLLVNLAVDVVKGVVDRGSRGFDAYLTGVTAETRGLVR
jgi:hypothetical protein